VKVQIEVEITKADVSALYKALEVADEGYVHITDNMVRLVRALDYALTDKEQVFVPQTFRVEDKESTNENHS